MTQGTPDSQTTSYTYDDLERLTSVSGAQSQTFTYDAIGNMTSNSQIGAYIYGDPAHKHAVTAAGSATYTYDANGNLTSGDGKTLTWDAEDRLTSVTQGGRTTTFVYDSGERRIQKTQGAGTSLYFGNLLEEVNGSPIQYYYAGPILVAKKDAAGTKHWYHADRLGSIRLMTDASGTEVKDYDYRPFGEVLASSGTASNERGFTGHIQDAETGLIYMLARYYEARLGRFLSADTLVGNLYDPQDLNRYSYVNNNPVNNTDPTGHIRVFAGWRRYVTWHTKTISRTIEIRIPYIIIYPTFHFYWQRHSVTISWRTFGFWGKWHHKTITWYTPAWRIVWHVKTGVRIFRRTIRFAIRYPVVHFRAIYRTIREKVHHGLAAVAGGFKRVRNAASRATKATWHRIKRTAGAVGRAGKAAGKAIASAAKATAKGAAKVAKPVGKALAKNLGACLTGGGLSAAFNLGSNIFKIARMGAGFTPAGLLFNAGIAFVYGAASVAMGDSIDTAIKKGLGATSYGMIVSTVVNVGANFVKDTAYNHYALGKDWGDSFTSAAAGVPVGIAATGIAVAGGFSKKAVIASSVVGFGGAQLIGAFVGGDD